MAWLWIPSRLDVGACGTFKTNVSDQVQEGVAPGLIASFQVGIDVEALHAIPPDAGDVVYHPVPLVVVQVDQMSSEVICREIVQKDIEVHDGSTLTLRIHLHGDAVVFLQISAMKAAGHRCPSEGGIVRIVGRTLSPQPGIDRDAESELPVVVEGQLAKALMLPTGGVGHDVEPLASKHLYLPLLCLQRVDRVHRPWHLGHSIQAERQEEQSDISVHSSIKVHLSAFSNNLMKTGLSNSNLLCPNWKYTLRAPLEGFVQTTGWSPILILVLMV